MGAQAGVTAEDLRKMADAALSKGAARDDVYAATVALTRNRHLSGADTFREILDIAPDVAAALGTTVASAAEKLGEAFGNGAAGVKKLDEELGFLSVEQARQVRQMNDQGNQAGALGVAMSALQNRFGGAAVGMRSAWGGAVDEMGLAWNAFVDRIANSKIAQQVGRGAANAARAFQEGVRGATGEEEAIAATRRRVNVEKELADIEGRNIKNPAIMGRVTFLRGEIGRLRSEEEALYEDLRRKAKEAEQRESAAPGIGKNQINPDEQKRLGEMRDALDRERDAMKGTSAERQVRLAGLQAERAALDAGRGPQAAKKEGLLAEERARLDLTTAIGDTTRQLGTEALANLGVADAYLKSSAAGQVAAARRQAMQESLQDGVNVESRTKDILQNQATALAATSAQSVAGLAGWSLRRFLNASLFRTPMRRRRSALRTSSPPKQRPFFATRTRREERTSGSPFLSRTSKSSF
jgi:trimeric autotransporter adhesin